MTAREVLAELEALGTAQNRKVYARHGVPPENLFGVSYANLEKLRKRLKVDHALAQELWASGHHDARNLACKIADPAALSARTIDAWSRDVRCRVDGGELATLVARSPHAGSCRAQWTASKNEDLCASGWHLVCVAAGDPDRALPDNVFEDYLTQIEAALQKEKNWVRYAMNSAVIAIGLRNPGLQKKAIAASKRIGKVEVDHGETGCKTPEVEAYLRKALATREKREARKQGAAKPRGKAKGGG